MSHFHQIRCIPFVKLCMKQTKVESPFPLPQKSHQNGMEVIVYPSGQLLKGTNSQNPPKSTIGPRLEAALRNSFYRNQARTDSKEIYRMN